MMRIAVLGVAVVVTVALAGCAGAGRAADQAGSGGASSGGAGGIAGMCAQDQPDCVDTPQMGDDPVPVDDESLAQFRRDARFYLGKPESELSDLIRVGRVDDEHNALTDDYRVGRITVELDTPDGGGNPVVTSATVEMPDGPERFSHKE